jgi:GT2 family glycosyltransferase
MDKPKVAVVILNFNTAELLRTLIPFVIRSSYENMDLIVADNASTDDSLAVIHSFAKQGVGCIELDQNYGFSGGYNEALKQVEAEYYILLNSDVEVTENWIEPLVRMAESNKDIAAIQPKLLDYYKRDHFEYAGASGGYIDKLAYPFCRGRLFDTLEKDVNQYNEPCEIFWASGAALFIRSNDYRAAGGLDADFFAHMEEIDLCWRLKNMGKQIWVCPDSAVYHMGGGTLTAQSPRKTFLNFRNNLALITKNTPNRQRPRLLLTRLILDGIAGLKYLLNFEFKHCMAVIKAHWNFFFRYRFWENKSHYTQHKAFLSHAGVYKKSIVKEFFISKKKTFSSLYK